MLDDKGRELVTQNLDVAKMVVNKHYKLLPILPRDELEAICYLALCSAADRWEDYCKERDFDPNNTAYFKPYAFKRMSGAINDKLRELDPLSRAQRKVVKENQTDSSTIPGNRMGGYLLVPDPEMLNDVPEKKPLTDSEVISKMLLSKVTEYYKQQDRETQVIVALYYYREEMLQEVAKKIGKTESHVSKVHTNYVLGLRKLLLEYLDPTSKLSRRQRES